jgi:pimeloyl-ACP methyl ester carboxylesterase
MLVCRRTERTTIVATMALLAVDDAGSGEPLVLIHGRARTREIWNVVRPQLSRSRRVVTLDVPGFGQSAPEGHHFFRRRLREILAAR